MFYVYSWQLRSILGVTHRSSGFLTPSRTGQAQTCNWAKKKLQWRCSAIKLVCEPNRQSAGLGGANERSPQVLRWR
jgi:hypothetical protein